MHLVFGMMRCFLQLYIIPLTDILKNDYPEYSDLAFLLKYHIVSILETIKNLVIV